MHPYSRGALKNQEILLANSSEQNLCEKICSYRGAKLDENRTSTPTSSTIMQSIGAVCRLIVISPAVSEILFGQKARCAHPATPVAQQRSDPEPTRLYDVEHASRYRDGAIAHKLRSVRNVLFMEDRRVMPAAVTERTASRQ